MTRKYDAQKVLEQAKQRRARALALLEQGKTLEQIGKRMGGITHQRVSQLVKQARKDLT